MHDRRLFEEINPRILALSADPTHRRLHPQPLSVRREEITGKVRKYTAAEAPRLIIHGCSFPRFVYRLGATQRDPCDVTGFSGSGFPYQCVVKLTAFTHFHMSKECESVFAGIKKNMLLWLRW